MRKRINKALLTATAAGATVTTLGFMAMGSATAAPRVFSPSGGTPVATNANCTVTPLPSDNCGMAGYEATGRDFRYAAATIQIPDHAGSITSPADSVDYVALDGSGTSTYQYTRVGIAPCPASTAGVFIAPGATVTCPSTGAGNTSNWIAFTATDDTGSAPTVSTHTISSTQMGAGIEVSVYLVPTGNAVHTSITLPGTTPVTYNNTFAITGPVYTKAEAVADWTTAIENSAAAPEPAVPSADTRGARFFDGRFTTTSGTAGTFSDHSAWTVTPLEATTNGSLPNAGTLIAQPSYLWNDGSSYKSMGDDAFSVWRYPF